MAMDFSSWEQLIYRAPGYPDDNERLLALQTLKVCVTEGPFANDDIAKNGYVVFDYVMFCYFVFRAGLCRTFPRDFVETYDDNIQHFMQLYFDDFFAIPPKKLSEFFNSRAGEYDSLPRDENMAYNAMETLTQYIHKDLDGIPYFDGYVTPDIFSNFDLQTKLYEYTVITLKALERQKELILMFEANKPARRPRQEPVQPKTDFVKPAVEQRETKRIPTEKKQEQEKKEEEPKRSNGSTENEQRDKAFNYILLTTVLKTASISIALLMMDVPLLIILLITTFMYLPAFKPSATTALIVECTYNIARPILYIVATVIAAGGDQNFFTITFYILTGIQALDMIPKFFGTIAIIFDLIKSTF